MVIKSHQNPELYKIVEVFFVIQGPNRDLQA